MHVHDVIIGQTAAWEVPSGDINLLDLLGQQPTQDGLRRGMCQPASVLSFITLLPRKAQARAQRSAERFGRVGCKEGQWVHG